MRRTLSATFWSSSANKENEPEIAFPNKSKKKPIQKFRIVEGKTRQTDGISFEVTGKQGTYLRVKGTSLVTDRDTQDSYFSMHSLEAIFSLLIVGTKQTLFKHIVFF